MSLVHSADCIGSIPSEPVFVFGSNLAGRHGKGAALWARQHRGAIYGVGKGPQGNSYAIPTKDERLKTLPLSEIEMHVVAFLIFAEAARHLLRFQVTPIGCGLAGYSPEQIAPFFRNASDNVILPPEFTAVLEARTDAAPSPSGMEAEGRNEPPTPQPENT